MKKKYSEVDKVFQLREGLKIRGLEGLMTQLTADNIKTVEDMKVIIFRFAQTVQKSSEWTVLKGISEIFPTDYPNESAEISHIDYKRTPCAYCNILGHKEQQCRKKIKDKKQRAVAHSRKSDANDKDDDAYEFRGTCYKCKKPGHKAFECPTKKRTSDESFPESGKGGKRYVPRPNIKRGKYNEVNCVESETSSIDSDTRMYLESCASKPMYSKGSGNVN